MALSRVQSVFREETTGGAISNAVTIAAPASGSLIVTALGGDKDIGADFAVPSGFTLLGSLYRQSNVSFGMAYKISNGTETTVSWVYGGVGATGANSEAWVGVYTGGTGTPLDVSAQNDSAGAAVTSLGTGTTATTAQADELALVMMAVDTLGNVTAPTWDNSFTTLGSAWNGSTNVGLAVGEKDLSATGTVTATYSGGGAGDQMAGGVVTFKAAAVVATGAGWSGAGWW